MGQGSSLSSQYLGAATQYLTVAPRLIMPLPNVIAGPWPMAGGYGRSWRGDTREKGRQLYTDL
jgi:hypothetical protein